MTVAMTAALVTVGGTLLAGKIQSNRTKDPKGAIGSGTSPSLSPGEGGQYTPVEGSQLQDFGDFQYENMTEPEGGDQEAQLLVMLQQAGISPEELGITGLAFGGEVEYKAGGGILDLLKSNPNLLESGALDMFNSLHEGANGDIIDFSQPMIEEAPVVKPYQEMVKQDALIGIQENIAIPSAELSAGTPLQETIAGVEGYAETNPEMFSAGLGALSDVVMAALRDMPEQKGSNVRTQTLPGNASRRRSQLQNISPIGGSSVTFAKNGSALQRPMFMPQGGAMNGPGGPKDDLIPVMASNGEYMLSKAAVDAAGNGSHAMGIANLNKFNDMGNKRYGN